VEAYAGRQFVGIDLHRRRSVIVRTDAAGEVLEKVQILNDADGLRQVMARAGQAPEVVLEATYGWYWAVDALQGGGARVHLAHPLGVKAFEYRRVKNDERDAADLADLLRMGRLPEAWIAPPATRELRELVRHRARLVAVRSYLKSQVHAVLAKCGVHVPVSDLFGVQGAKLLDRLLDSPPAGALPAPYAARVASLRRIMDQLDFEIDTFARLARGRLIGDDSFAAVQTIPGIGPTFGALFVAEIGDVTRFPAPEKLTCWAGMTPRHHESDTHVHRGRITKQGNALVRWAAVESVQRLPATSLVGAVPRAGRRPPRPQHRRGRRRPPTARARLLRPARPPRPRPSAPSRPTRRASDGGGMSRRLRTGRCVIARGHDPRTPHSPQPQPGLGSQTAPPAWSSY
jgi:transposase